MPLYLLLLTIVVEILSLALYLFAPFCQSGKRPLIAKCTCSVLFILIGVFAMLASQNFSIFSKMMLCGLFFSFWGDYFLGVSMRGKFFIAGMLSFFIAHVFYIIAYFKATAAKFPGTVFLNKFELGAIAVFLVVLFIASYKLKLNMGVMKIPVSLYAVIISTMLVKAISLSIRVVQSGMDNWSSITVLLAGGAILFVISDAVLSLILFGDKDKRSFTVLNLITYFSGQILLASSIYFLTI